MSMHEKTNAAVEEVVTKRRLAELLTTYGDARYEEGVRAEREMIVNALEERLLELDGFDAVGITEPEHLNESIALGKAKSYYVRYRKIGDLLATVSLFFIMLFVGATLVQQWIWFS